jgi:hypothetical protein
MKQKQFILLVRDEHIRLKSGLKRIISSKKFSIKAPRKGAVVLGVEALFNEIYNL